ncbi:hypothetical protein GTY20_37860 [Streptomyces sp. SID4946]|uniref:hypothetical protein n=1 Tax=Streptomyces TaxID=1883 RepID=UPI00081E8E00|nr:MULTISPECIES: hypothetical protein [unclassified Streptomyces]MYQ96596.1 hypothetical protein [Streptomyces sp. SID4946]SCG01236.1 hypothetical protein GA0115256_143610 [Streptomyces sp. DconLS]SCG05687.1 hypothetical protein GA0115258_128720 [Streptomyces sp. LamerLS-31b]
MADSGSTFLIVERAHRGAVEAQFSDELYFARALHRMSGSVDVLLRGPATGYAIDTGPVPAPPSAHGTALPLADPRHSLRALLADGAPVWVEEAGLALFGASASTRLMPDVRLVARDDDGPDWSKYDRVWFF